MGKRVDALINSLVETARSNGGLAIMEVWTCPRCRQLTFHYHQMRESIPCGHCGHRVASGLPRYQKFADGFVEQR